MRFKDRLQSLMKELNLSQAQISELTGIGRSSISQYLSGVHEPSNARKREMAIALGVDENYFTQYTPAEIKLDGCFNLPVKTAAKLLGKSREWVMQGLQDGVFPWGYAVKLEKWSYYISSKKFTECTGIEIPADAL